MPHRVARSVRLGGPGCLTGTTCRTGCRSGRSANPSLWHAAPPVDSEPLRELIGSCQSPGSCTTSSAGLELRSLPSTGVTRLRRYYGPLRHPAGPDSDPRGPSVGGHAPPPRGASRVAFGLLRMHAVATTPAEPLGASLVLPSDGSLPCYSGRSASALPFSRPARRSLTLRPVCSRSRPRRPFPSKTSAASLPPQPLRLLPAGATVAGRVSFPLKTNAFARRTE